MIIVLGARQQGVGEKIKRLRTNRAMSWADVAELCQLESKTTVQALEKGRDPRLSSIQALSTGFGVPIDYWTRDITPHAYMRRRLEQLPETARETNDELLAMTRNKFEGLSWWAKMEWCQRDLLDKFGDDFTVENVAKRVAVLTADDLTRAFGGEYLALGMPTRELLAADLGMAMSHIRRDPNIDLDPETLSDYLPSIHYALSKRKTGLDVFTVLYKGFQDENPAGR